MLLDLSGKQWWYMEVPRTGTSTIERTLKHIFPNSKAIYAKHWPILPPEELVWHGMASVISIRNPYSRAVSCWQFFTKPGQYTFEAWLEERRREGFCEVNIEARPQSFWFDLWDWTEIIHQETLESDFRELLKKLSPTTPYFQMPRYNDINGNWVNRVRVKTSRDRPWYEYFCPKTEKLVLELYDKDFDSLAQHYSKTFPAVTALS